MSSDKREETGELPILRHDQPSSLGAGMMSDIGYRGVHDTLHPDTDDKRLKKRPERIDSEVGRMMGLPKNSKGEYYIPGD